MSQLSLHVIGKPHLDIENPRNGAAAAVVNQYGTSHTTRDMAGSSLSSLVKALKLISEILSRRRPAKPDNLFEYLLFLGKG